MPEVPRPPLALKVQRGIREIPLSVVLLVPPVPKGLLVPEGLLVLPVPKGLPVPPGLLVSREPPAWLVPQAPPARLVLQAPLVVAAY